MSLTEKTYVRFWASMGERYGSRWLDTYGEKPTHAWRETLQAFTPKDIARAMDALALREDTQQFPPTEPAFKALLVQASRSHAKPADDPNELRRGYWRSTILAHVARGLEFRDLAEFEPVLVANRSLGVAMKTLLDDVNELEHATGQRTPGQEAMTAQRCHEIVAAFRQLKQARAA